jgi:hypothetical protein
MNLSMNSYLFTNKSNDSPHDKEYYLLDFRGRDFNAPNWISQNHYAQKLKNEEKIIFWIEDNKDNTTQDKVERVQKTRVEKLKDIANRHKLVIGEHIAEAELEEKICNDMDISMKKLEELINVQ